MHMRRVAWRRGTCAISAWEVAIGTKAIGPEASRCADVLWYEV